MSLLLGPEPFQKFGVGGGGWVGGGWWWSKGILEFRFGPNLGLRLEAWTKLNNTEQGWADTVKMIISLLRKPKDGVKWSLMAIMHTAWAGGFTNEETGRTWRE